MVCVCVCVFVCVCVCVCVRALIQQAVLYIISGYMHESCSQDCFGIVVVSNSLQCITFVTRPTFSTMRV